MSVIDLSKRLDLSAFCDFPLAAPPEGQISNFDNPPSQANLPRIFTYVTLPPMVIFLLLRFYTRIFITRQVGIDDYLCVLAAATVIAQIGIMFELLNTAGPHDWDIRLCKITDNYPRYSILQSILFPIAAMFIKMAVLALYRRIFGPVRLANTLIWAGLVFTLGFYLSLVIAFCATSIPRASDYASGGWLSLTYDARANYYAEPLAATCGIVGAILDLYILIIPIYFVWNLRMSTKNKLGVASIFFTGSVATAFSVAGAYFRYRLILNPGYDLSWRAMPVYATNVAEINIGIVCSCMPIIFVLFKSMLEKSVSWASKIWSSRSTSRRLGPKSMDLSTTGASSSQMNPYKEVGNKQETLPQVPQGTLTGLRSFMRNAGRSRPMKTQTTVTVNDVVLTPMSGEYDYYGQQRGGLFGRQPGQYYQTPIGQVYGEQRIQVHQEQGGQIHEEQEGSSHRGHFREALEEYQGHDYYNQDQNRQFTEEHNSYDYLGQLREASAVGVAR